MLRSHLLATGWLLMWVVPACSGAVSPEALNDERGNSGGEDATSTSSPAPSTPHPANDNPAAPTPPSPAPGEVTRLARLTHTQYANTISDLFGIENMADAFPPDALNGFEFRSSVDFVIDTRLAPQYQQAAETIAARVVADAAVFERVVTCDDESTACRDRFVAEFGLRAFRRPLTSGEQSQLVTLFDAGSDLVGSSNAFHDGVQVVVEAALQSPHFLYRTELSNATDRATVPLDDFEVASRLSYFLYDSMPDTELFAAASAGELSTVAEVRAQVERMLKTEAATKQLVTFHEQAWHFDRYTRVAPDPSVFPGLPSDLSTRLGEASRRFVREVITSRGGLRELLTAPYAYADAAIGRLYDVEVEGELARIELDPKARLGLLSQVGFLVSHAHSQKTDPIHRGLFVTRDLLCRPIGEPPAGASMAKLPEGSPKPKTTREEVTLLTSPSGCVECHRIINPPGFAFEGFDAVGKVRTEEGGTAVDTQTTMYIDGADHEVSNAVDLIHLLASSTEAHTCYASKWLTFAHGRKLASHELRDQTSLQTPTSVHELVTAIATDPTFLTRPTTEVSR